VRAPHGANIVLGESVLAASHGLERVLAVVVTTPRRS
jgi:hypothetical protein